MKKSIVITGATGFIGINLTNLLLKEGYRVYAIVRSDSDKRDKLPLHPELKIVLGDLDHVLAVVDQIGSADAWFHFAWAGVNRNEIDSPEIQEKNIQGSLMCVRAAHLLGCRVFMDAGSRVEYGVTEEIMTESLECHPVNEYGKAKLKFYDLAKQVCKQNQMVYYHLRFFSVYGYGDHPWSIISTLLNQLSNNQDVALSACLHRWNFMYIEDAVQAVYQLYAQIAGYCNPQIVNIASEDTRVLRMFVEEIKRIVGGQGKLVYGTFVQAKEGALSIVPDIAVLKKLTNGKWKEAFPFHSGISETLRKEMECANENNQHFDSLL